jgi:hypothetical protein
MRSLLLSTALLLVAHHAMAIEFTDNSPQTIGTRHVNRAVAAVVRHLAAPETAKFRGLYLGTNPAQRGVVCGFVTARDRNGKLSGFQPFIYNPRSNDAVFMPMKDFRSKDVGMINSSLYRGVGCGALLGRSALERQDG